MTDETYYEILGISEDTKVDEIKRSYRRLASLYHPDKVEHLGPKLKQIAEDELKKLNDAKEVLLDEKQRMEYDEMIGADKKKEIEHDDELELDWDHSAEFIESEKLESDIELDKNFPCFACGHLNKQTDEECERCHVHLFEFLKIEFSLHDRVQNLENMLLTMKIKPVHYFDLIRSLEKWYHKQTDKARDRAIEDLMEHLSESLIHKDLDPENYFELISDLRELWKK